MVVVLSQPYMCSSSYSQAKIPPRSTKIFKTRVIVVYYTHTQRERERERERERAFQKMNDKVSCSKMQIRISAHENTTYIVWFK